MLVTKSLAGFTNGSAQYWIPFLLQPPPESAAIPRQERRPPICLVVRWNGQ
jgi:hypothetical protein